MSFPGDFSIEMTAERIADSRTKEYFREAYSSYSNGNFRSAVVMLWSVVVCDTLFKLDELRNLYNDKTAESILNEIEELQKRNSKSPEWEIKLLEKVHERTSLIDITEFNNLESLQKHRHLSAHPVLTSGYTLFAPSREIVRAHIRSALEGLLIKPALMTKKIFDAFVEDISQTQKSLPDDISLRRYLDAKYLKRMSPPVEDSLFKGLWRLVFKLTDAQCEKNRDINFRALRILLNRRPLELTARIQAERDYYSNIAPTGSPLEKMFELLGEHQRLYTSLTDAARIPIENFAKSNDDHATISWFISGDIGAHVTTILDRAKNGNLDIGHASHSRLVSIASTEGHQEAAIEIGIHLYTNSFNYNEADERFAHFIEPYIDLLNENHLLICLNGIEANTQTYRRAQARTDHARFKEACERVWGTAFNPAQYPHFANSI